MSDDKDSSSIASNDYLKAKERPPLEVPEDLSSASIQPTMAIPKITSSQRHVNFEGGAPRPEAIYAREEAEGVKIQKLGDQRWLLIPQPPAVVWPKVKQFFADNGVAIAAEHPETGRIDTEWLTISNARRARRRALVYQRRQASGRRRDRTRSRARAGRAGHSRPQHGNPPAL